MARVRVHEVFFKDQLRQQEWLIEHDREEWLINLLGGLQELAELLGKFPEAGRVIAADERLVLRRMTLRRYPYFIWYGHVRGRPIREVWLLRLFGAHQARADPDLTPWSLQSR